MNYQLVKILVNKVETILEQNASSLCSKIISTLGGVHKLRLQEEGGR